MNTHERYIQEEFRRELEDASLTKIRYPSADDFAKIIEEAKKFIGKGPCIFPRSQTKLDKLFTKYFERKFYNDRLISAYNREYLDYEAEVKTRKEKTVLKPIPNDANEKKATRKAIYKTIAYPKLVD